MGTIYARLSMGIRYRHAYRHP